MEEKDIPNFEDWPEHAQTSVLAIHAACELLMHIYQQADKDKLRNETLTLMMHDRVDTDNMYQITVKQISKELANNYTKHNRMVEPMTGRNANDIINEN